MTLAVYPSDVRGLTFTVTKQPSFNTLVQESRNRFQTRILQSQNPLWKWTLLYDYLYASTTGFNNALLSGRSYADFQLLMGFFLSKQGRFSDFLFLDPDDHHVGPGIIGAAPNLKAELGLVTDGTLFYSPIQRNMGGQFLEDVTDLVPGSPTIAVYANGVLKTLTTDYTIAGPGLAVPGASYGGMYIQWVTEPSGPITATFDFYFRCHFLTDEQGFDKFMQDLWAIGGQSGGNSSGLEIESSRPIIEC